MTRAWQFSTPEHKDEVRAALAGVLEGWLRAGTAYLTPQGGWPLGPPASSSEAWAAMPYVLAHASDAVARCSEATIRADAPEDLEDSVRNAHIQIDRLAALIIGELAQASLERHRLLEEAAEFVSEVDDEHDGVGHSADAIGSLLQAKMMCAEEGFDLPETERTDAAVKILAPLLAQRASFTV